MNKKVFNNTNLLISSIGVSSIGDTVFNIAIMWVVYQETHSALSASLIGVIWHLSSTLVSPFAGTLVDRKSPKNIMIGAYLFSGLVCLLLVIGYYVLPQYVTALIYLLVFLLNSIYSFVLPAKNKMLGYILPKEKIVTTNGTITSVNQVSDLIGNSISGFLLGAVGLAGSILLNSFTFFIAALLVGRLTILAHGNKESSLNKKDYSANNSKKNSYKQDLLQGFKVVLGNKTITKLVILVLLINVSSLIGPLYVVLVSEQLDGGPAAFGIIQGVGVLGGITGGLVMRYIKKLLRPGIGLSVSWIIAGIMIIVISHTTSITLACILFFVISLFFIIGNVFFSSLMILLVPDEYRGRVGGVTFSLSIILIPFATLVGGFLTDLYNVSVVFTYAGLWIIIIGFLAITFKEVRTLEKI